MIRPLLLGFGIVGAFIASFTTKEIVAIAAGLGATFASVTAGISWIGRWRKDRMATLKLEQDYCAKCDGKNGLDCPLPKDLRPASCPHKGKV